jgi:MFS family permease
MSEGPLRRNRDFVLLQAGQLLPAIGTASTTVAYPLLALAVTHSPAWAGLVTFARIFPSLLFSLPGGVAADRLDRKKLTIVSDICRAAAVSCLAVPIFLGDLRFWLIPVVAFVEGSFTSLFSSSAAGALRSVVPARQLPAAVAAQQGRSATASLAGPPLGGALFGISRGIPFLADAASYVFSVVPLILMRTAFQETRQPGAATVRSQLSEGFQFLWGQPFLRTTTFLYGLTNFIGPGVLLAIVVIGDQQGLRGWQIGVLLAAFSACVLAGSMASGFARRVLAARALMLLELWAYCPGARTVRRTDRGPVAERRNAAPGGSRLRPGRAAARALGDAIRDAQPADPQPADPASVRPALS